MAGFCQSTLRQIGAGTIEHDRSLPGVAAILARSARTVLNNDHPVLLIVGDEDVACLETNLMLKATQSNAGLWISPNTGHTINLEEPAAFNAHLETFLGAVERGSWRRSYTTARIGSRRTSHLQSPERHVPIQLGPEQNDRKVILLHQANDPADISPSEVSP